MSKIVLNGLDVISIFNSCYSIGMTQIMETSFFQSQFANNFFEVLVDCNMRQMPALLIGEHKVVFVFPNRPRQ